MPVFDKRGPVDNVANEIVRRVNDDTKRLRLLEQRVITLDSRVGSMDQTLLESFREIKGLMDKFSARIEESNERMSRIEEDLRKVLKTLEKGATKIELKELQGFIDLINPMRAEFVTKGELERAIKEVKEEKRAFK